MIKIALLMKNKFSRFPLTFAAIVFAVIVVAAALVGHVNVFKIPILVVSRFEQSEIGEDKRGMPSCLPVIWA